MLNSFMALKRYRPPVGASGHSLTPTAKTLSANLETSVIKGLIELTDLWAKKLKVSVMRSANSSIRRKVGKKKAANSYVMGIHMPVQLADQITGTAEQDYSDGLTHKHERSVSFILGWAVSEGFKHLTVEGLIEAYPTFKPSLNLASLLALEIGLRKFRRVFAVREATPGGEKEVLQSIISQSAESQRISRDWSKMERSSIAKRLRRKARNQEDVRRTTALQILATMVEKEPAEFLDQMRKAIDAELGAGFAEK